MVGNIEISVNKHANIASDIPIIQQKAIVSKCGSDAKDPRNGEMTVTVPRNVNKLAYTPAKQGVVRINKSIRAYNVANTTIDRITMLFFWINMYYDYTS